MRRVAHDNGRVVDEIGPAKPATVAQCHEVIDALTQQVDLLRQQVVQQDEKLAVLQERLKLDSKNSSKPTVTLSPKNVLHSRS